MNEIVFLVVLTLTSTGNAFTFNYHEMKSMEVCQECVKTSKIELPKSGDAEAVVAIYCAESKATP